MVQTGAYYVPNLMLSRCFLQEMVDRNKTVQYLTPSEYLIYGSNGANQTQNLKMNYKD